MLQHKEAYLAMYSLTINPLMKIIILFIITGLSTNENLNSLGQLKQTSLRFCLIKISDGSSFKSKYLTPHNTRTLFTSIRTDFLI